MISNQPQVLTFADRLATLKETYKADCDAVMEDAEAAEVDKPGLRRLVSWRGKDAAKRAEQEAIDDQYRFLAGDRPTAAALPPDSELAKAIALYAANQTVRQVAETLDVSVGKAQKLRTLAKAFDVHFPVNVNKVNAREMTADDLGEVGIPTTVREMVADDLGDPLWVVDKDRAKFKEKIRTISADVQTRRCAKEISQECNPDSVLGVTSTPEEIDLTIPPFLRRERVSA